MMKKQVVVWSMVLSGAVALAGELSVSPSGLSPQEALMRIRAAKAAGDASPWTVRVAPGLYELKAPLVFTPADSGTPAAPVKWVADGGEAVFAGGGRVAGWRDDGDGAWSAPLPKDATGAPVWFQSLYVNGRRAVRARHPNVGFFSVDAWHQASVTNADGSVVYVQHSTVSNAAANVLAGLSREELAAVELRAVIKWSYGAFSVTGWDAAARELTVCSYAEKVANWKTWPGAGNLFWLENVRPGFDAPGEWFYDVTAGRVRYRPLPGETLANLEALAPTARLVSIVRFEGDLAADRAVTDISFEGVTFALSRTDGDVLPSGFVQQYQHQGACDAGGCVYARGARRISLVRCRATKTDNYAIRFDVGCVSNRVVGCELTDLGAGGVMVGDSRSNYFKHKDVNGRVPFPGRVIPYGDQMTAAFHPCAFITIDDCEIAHAGLVNPEGCGVLITQASDSSVTHCDIHDLYYTGVSVGWTWGYSGSLSQRNTIAFNRISDIGKGVMSDMGGIYTLGTSFGTCISNNVIHTISSYTYGGWGLYNDEGSEGIVWENNLVYDMKDSSCHQHYGRNNIIRNNIFACAGKCQLAVTLAETHRSLTFERNIVYWENDSPVFKDAGSRYSCANGTWERIRVEDSVRPVADVAWKDNLLWCGSGPTVINAPLTAVVADPLFVDAKARDFRLKAGSPALGIGFRPWDCSRSGRRTLARAPRADWAGRIGERSIWLSTEGIETATELPVLWGGSSPVPSALSRTADGRVTLTKSYSHPDHPDWAWMRTLSFTPGTGDAMDCVFFETRANRPGKDVTVTGTVCRLPPLPVRPDLKSVRYGEPIDLLKDGLDGFDVLDNGRASQWRFADGILENGGSGANIRTKRTDFRDFKISCDVRVDKDCNSGVYLRGIYELQIADSFGKPVDSHNMAALYGRIVPSVSAEKPAGEWQRLEAILCRHHLTVWLNGTCIIDNEPIRGITGGALSTDESAPGPIGLQGDHQGGTYRNLIVTPILEESVVDVRRYGAVGDGVTKDTLAIQCAIDAG